MNLVNHTVMYEGALGPVCGFGQFLAGFLFFALKICGFSVLLSCVVCRFSPIKFLVLGFCSH